MTTYNLFHNVIFLLLIQLSQVLFKRLAKGF